jgi:hypothetical protein
MEAAIARTAYGPDSCRTTRLVPASGSEDPGSEVSPAVPIEDFIVDFYCDELKLVIEIDGDVHDKSAQIERDKVRDERLSSLGYRVLRFPNAVVINDPDVLIKAVRGLRPSPGALTARRPLPEGEG